MALSFSQSLSLSVSYCPFLHGNSPFSPQMQRMHTSKVSADLMKFPSIRCSSGFNDKSSFTLQTCKNCKSQFDPALNHPLACRFHAAHFGECRSRRSSICRANAVGQNTENSYVEAYAVGRNIRMSADKARRVTEQLCGRSYEQTLMILELMPYRACEPILKLVFSAAANASHNMGVNKGSLVISKAFVNEGSTMKRVRPQARGRAHPIRKRTCHITIAVRGLASDSEQEAKPA